jgi:membrane protein DedA with SNARE-associated domain
MVTIIAPRHERDIILESLFLLLTELQGSSGIFAIFGILVLCGLGVPIPEDIPLIAAGYLIHLHQTNWVTAYFVSMAGVLIGDSIIFFMGKRLGQRVFRSRLAMMITTPKRIRKVIRYYQRYGQKVIVAGRFLPGLRAPIFFVAGGSLVPYSTFLTFDALAAAVSVPVWLFLGSRFGDTIDSLLVQIQHGKRLVMAVLGVLIVVYFIYLFWKARLAKKRVAIAESEK